MKLPSPNTEPLDDSARTDALSPARNQFLASLIGPEPVFHLQITQTKLDVGAWFFKQPVCAGMLEDELLLFAPGKLPYVERVPFGELSQSEYNHVTGEVVLAPFEGTRVSSLKMPPLEGLQVLAQIRRGGQHGTA